MTQAAQNPEPKPLELGSSIGDYVLIDVLGKGGMGIVYRARHKVMERIVALKTLHPQAVASASALERFQREVKIAARLSHPNIVTAYDAGRQNGLHYLVMEYIDGVDLATLVKTQGAVPLPRALDYVLQAAEGLRYAHEIGLVHRDIKPHNLLLDKSGTVKILDLGLARLNLSMAGLSEGLSNKPDGDITNTGVVLGTFQFMAPEQARNTKLADQRADIYSLGCTLHYLLSGRAPFRGDTLMEIFLAHQNDAVNSLQSEGRDVPAPIDKVWRKMLAKDPAQRQQSMAEVIRELRTVGGVPTPARNDSMPIRTEAQADGLDTPTVDRSATLRLPSAQMPRSHRRRWLVVGAVAGLALLAVLFAFVGSGNRSGSNTQTAKPPVATTFTNDLGMEFRTVPVGTFRMGSTRLAINQLSAMLRDEGWQNEFGDRLAAESDVQVVNIERPFQVGVTEVTIGQFRRFADDAKYQTTAERSRTGWGVVDGAWDQGDFSYRNLGEHPATDDYPAVSISFDDAAAFCVWLTRRDQAKGLAFVYRLPTETEWEYACRAGSTSLWGVTNRIDELGNYAWYNANSNDRIHPVRQLEANAWGLYDMLGNEREWCNRDGREKAQRGGSFNESAFWCRPACRFLASPSSTQHGAFRVVRVPEGR